LPSKQLGKEFRSCRSSGVTESLGFSLGDEKHPSLSFSKNSSRETESLHYVTPATPELLPPAILLVAG
jgi:hypothetical protein